MSEKKSGLGLKVAILLSGGIALADVAIYPAAEKIYETYPDASIGILNFILTGPSLVIIFASILCGILARYVSKKHLVVYGYLAFILSSFACVVIDHPLQLAVMRAIMGATMGIVSTAMVGLIAELFVNENNRSSILGFYNGFMSALGAVFSLVAGYLALIDWHYVFLVFLIMIPITIAIIIFVPKVEPEGKVQGGESDGEPMPYGRVLALAAAAFIINSMYAVILTQIAPIVSELGIGDASIAGGMTSLGTLGSLIACFSFGFIYDRCKNFIPVLYSFVLGLGFLGIYFSDSVFMLGMMCTILGAMYGLSYSYYLMHASVIVPTAKASLAIAIANAAVYLGIFIGPYTPRVYQAVLGKSSIVATLPYVTLTLMVCGFISLVFSIRHLRKSR